ncbi:Iron-sulfur flavoprotein [Sporotomaculum syntrophicum]|uniref:Iron-sulfur flavoprotein n=1 Tax=Sporotomaculum syntrophicum TaxID=182264 RepID=A0A9D2WQQ9_9FIRM|nr:flavodoxin family protein [Sporotomaculum syntrophicum]KAF1085704.1 Iron-sulfur flavoprotein [Sporotomaculum syntrophicum]
MKIIGLNGSPRKSQSRTGQLVQEILNSAGAAGAETEYLNITDLKLDFCIACGKCHHIGYCILKDDFEPLMEKIIAADGLVVGSPVYIYQITAQLKVWVDRLGGPTIHCQKLLGKYGAVVSTSGGAGENETAQYLEATLINTGMQCVGRIASGIELDGLLPLDSPLMQNAQELGLSLVRAIEHKQEFPEQTQVHHQFREFFRYVISQQQEAWNWEYKYWQEKGWL